MNLNASTIVDMPARVHIYWNMHYEMYPLGSETLCVAETQLILLDIY